MYNRNSIDPDQHLYMDDLQVVAKYRYFPEDDLAYKRDMRQRESEWQNETFWCECKLPIRRRDTWWFFNRTYDAIPQRVKDHVHCVPCLMKHIMCYKRTCVDCGNDYFLPMLTSKTIHCEQCRSLYANENARLKRHIKRAKDVGLPATLTVEEWIQTIKDFNRVCAYCQENAYLVMDHFVPICHSGGTTVSNCVPACDSCNSSKGNAHPDWLASPYWIKGAIARVRVYLATR